MEFTNKWNINMNTLDLADYNVKEPIKLWGFVAEENKEIQSYIYQDENDCVCAWYQMRCASMEQISKIESIEIIETENIDVEILKFREKMKQTEMIPLLHMTQARAILEQHPVLQFTLVCYGILPGTQADSMSSDQIKQYGYGLVYLLEEKVCVFFDNRFAVMFRKLNELWSDGICPICVRVKKDLNLPIQVSAGRSSVLKEVSQYQLKEMCACLKQFAE